MLDTTCAPQAIDLSELRFSHIRVANLRRKPTNAVRGKRFPEAVLVFLRLHRIAPIDHAGKASLRFLCIKDPECVLWDGVQEHLRGDWMRLRSSDGQKGLWGLLWVDCFKKAGNCG